MKEKRPDRKKMSSTVGNVAEALGIANRKRVRRLTAPEAEGRMNDADDKPTAWPAEPPAEGRWAVWSTRPDEAGAEHRAAPNGGDGSTQVAGRPDVVDPDDSIRAARLTGAVAPPPEASAEAPPAAAQPVEASAAPPPDAPAEPPRATPSRAVTPAPKPRSRRQARRARREAKRRQRRAAKRHRRQTRRHRAPWRLLSSLGRLVAGLIKVVVVVAVGLLVGGGIGLGAATLLSRDDPRPRTRPDNPAATPQASRDPEATPAETAPTPTATPRAADAAASVASIPVPGAAGDAVQLMFLGDELLQGEVRERIVRALSKRRAVTAVDRFTGPAPLTSATVSAMPSGVDLAFISIGTNDWKVTDLDEFATAYTELIARAREASPDAELVCLGVYRPDDSFETGALNDIIRSRCKGGTPILISDAYDGTADSSDLRRIARAVTRRFAF